MFKYLLLLISRRHTMKKEFHMNFADNQIALDTAGQTERSITNGVDRLNDTVVAILFSWTSLRLPRPALRSIESLTCGIKKRPIEQVRLLRLRYQIQKERKELSSLPDHLLNDIGINRGRAEVEAARKFNDIPANRLEIKMIR